LGDAPISDAFRQCGLKLISLKSTFRRRRFKRVFNDHLIWRSAKCL
jgi:hypothetical protein